MALDFIFTHIHGEVVRKMFSDVSQVLELMNVMMNHYVSIISRSFTPQHIKYISKSLDVV